MDGATAGGGGAVPAEKAAKPWLTVLEDGSCGERDTCESSQKPCILGDTLDSQQPLNNKGVIFPTNATPKQKRKKCVTGTYPKP